MYPDGVCRVTDNYYTKTVQFQDINYQLNQNEDKTAIFDGWCDFLNYFDSSIRFQLSFINLSATRDTYARRIAIPLQGDCFDKLRTEYTGMLQSQLARGNNGLIKTKYLTFGVEADSLKAAKPRLERIETDILNNFRRLGVMAESLNGMERLRLLHGMGEVWARTWYDLSVSVPLKTTEKTGEGRKKLHLSLDFGRRRIKFYGKGSITGANCDKITDYKPLTLPGGLRLPVTLVVERTCVYDTRPAERSAEQARQEGEENLLAQLQSLLPEGSRVDETHFAAARQGDTLLVTLRAVCTEQIGRPVVLENPAG